MTRSRVGLAESATCTLKVAAAVDAKLPLVNLTGPVPPTAGVVVVHPAGDVAETKVVSGGSGKSSTVACASFGPWFDAVRMNVIVDPGGAGLGLPPPLSVRSEMRWTVVVTVAVLSPEVGSAGF